MGTSAVTTPISLADAISAVEQNLNTFKSTETKLADDQGVRDSIAAKLAAQDVVIADDQANRKSAGKAFNASVRTAIAVFESAIIPGVDDPAPPSPPAA